MNRNSSVSLGPGASSLILIFVALAMTVLGMLSLMTARNDLKFSERSAEVIEAVYQLNEQAEEHHMQIEELLAGIAAVSDDEESYLSNIENALPEDMEYYEGEITWEESDESRIIDCALQVLPLSEKPRIQWIRHNLMGNTGDEEWF